MSDWGPWVKHDGKGCPIPKGVVVNVQGVASDGTKQTLIDRCDPDWAGWFWTHAWIRDYRIRKDPSVELMKTKAAALDRVSPKNLENVE